MNFEHFKNEYAPQMNRQQAAAVKKTEGPALLLAVPGSGKTSVIVARLGYMVLGKGIPPENILTVTYTVAATRDMRSRFQAVFGPELAGKLEFRTINGLCAMVIRYYERVCGTHAFELLSDEGEFSRLINELHVRRGGEYLSESELKDVRRRIAFCKNMMLTDDEIKLIKVDGVDFYSIYESCRKYMRKNRLMDYDDQMVYALSILRKYPDILERFQERYRYINVDESQDTSKIQHVILRLLASKHRNLFMVGDEDQSIYGFRAAYPQALLDFAKVFPEAEVLMMEKNYRSTPEIVDPANNFIRRNGHRFKKNMHTDNPPGEKIKHTSLKDCRNQYKYLAAIAKNCRADTAVLYRNNDSALPLIDILEREGIAYNARQLEGGFFTHYTVRDITDTMRFALEPENGEIFSRIYYKFGCGLKKEALNAALCRQHKKNREEVIDLLLATGGIPSWTHAKLKALQTHLRHFSSISTLQAVHRIMNYMGYGEYLGARGGDFSRINVMMALADQNPDIPAFLARLDELGGIVASGSGAGESRFTLSTIHSSKGLEYDHVILIDVIDGLFPSIPEPEPDEELEEEDLLALEEDRRLFYVGMTRARKRLEIITYENEYGKSAKPISSFVRAVIPIEQSSKPEKKPVPPVRWDIASAAKDFMPRAAVDHKAFGDGVITGKKGDIISVRFRGGEKRLSLSQCLEKGLITLR